MIYSLTIDYCSKCLPKWRPEIDTSLSNNFLAQFRQMGGCGSSINTSITTVHIALLFIWYFYIVNFTVAFLLLNGSLEIMLQMSVYYLVWQQYISVRKHMHICTCVHARSDIQISSLYRWSQNSTSETLACMSIAWEPWKFLGPHQYFWTSWFRVGLKRFAF